MILKRCGIKSIRLFLLIICICWSAGKVVSQTPSLSLVGEISAFIVNVLGTKKIQDMRFSGVGRGPIPVGAPADTIFPWDVNAAVFQIVGSPYLNYTVTLPANGTTIMRTLGGNFADEQIRVNSFSYSSQNGSSLGPDGRDIIRVGATRDAIRPTQRVGPYRTTFEIIITF
jgi:hypothetical protein